MKTFADIRVGDSIYYLDGVSLTIHKVEDIWKDEGGGAVFIFGKEGWNHMSAFQHQMGHWTINRGYYCIYFSDPDEAIKFLNSRISFLHKGIRDIEEDINTNNT